MNFLPIVSKYISTSQMNFSLLLLSSSFTKF